MDNWSSPIFIAVEGFPGLLIDAREGRNVTRTEELCNREHDLEIQVDPAKACTGLCGHIGDEVLHRLAARRELDAIQRMQALPQEMQEFVVRHQHRGVDLIPEKRGGRLYRGLWAICGENCGPAVF